MNLTNKNILINIIIVVCFFLLQTTAYAQKTSISGKIKNKDTGEPIPYVNVVFENTSIGTYSDIQGMFKIESKAPVKTLVVFAVGYKKQKINLDSIKSSFFNIELKEDIIPIDEITVTPGVNPAHKLLREVIERKDINNPNKLPDWNTNLYSKIEIDLKNVKIPKKNSKLWNQIDFISSYVDTLDTDGKTFLPVFINETSSNYSHFSDGTTKEQINASKTSGMQTSMVTEFTRELYTEVNPYDNFFTLNYLGLISPLNNQGLLYYKYFLRDSSIVDGRKIYEISFFPKQKQTPTFKGKFWIADSSFALTKIEMTLSETANINFLKQLVFEKSYVYKDNHYIPEKESLWGDFNIQKKDKGKLIGLIGRKSMVYNDFYFIGEDEKPKNKKTELTFAANSLKFDDQYWDSIRPVELNQREANIYSMVDSLKNVPIIKTTFDYLHMFFFGYRDFGKFEVGPYFYMFSNNAIEGPRFRVGGRTTLEFDQNVRLNGYLAYGTKDEKFKYGSGIEYFFNKEKRFSIQLQYKHDYELLGKSENAFNEDNILTAFVSKRKLSKLNMVDNIYFKIDKEWSTTFSNTIKISTSKISSSEFVPFENSLHEEIPNIRNTEISLNTRISPNEKTVLVYFEKTSFGSNLPIANFTISTGVKNVFSSNYEYLKLHADIYDELLIHPIGYTSYLIQGGYIFGNTPFPLMKIHEGNETYSFNPYAFNLMNYQEFVSDRYASISLEHHFQGFFLNKIPLIRKLQWREIVATRWLIGDANLANHQQIVFPQGMQSLNGNKYGEASVGIENIFKLLRVDAIWRLTDNNVTHDRFALNFSIQFIF